MLTNFVFQPLGDPTVRKFLSRDLDSWILPREREAVREWEHQETVTVIIDLINEKTPKKSVREQAKVNTFKSKISCSN